MIKKQYKVRLGEVTNNGRTLTSHEIVETLNQQDNTIRILKDKINGLTQTLWVQHKENENLRRKKSNDPI